MATKTRAAVLTGPRQVEMREISVPEIDENSGVVRVEVTGVCGVDWPAYKGITLASSTAVALAELGLNLPYSYNRKERKDHGEGGELVGAPLHGRVMIVDDVITDGAAKREALELIRTHGAQPAGVVIMLDRMERTGADGALSAVSAVRAFEQTTDVPVISIANLDDLISLLRSDSPLAAKARPYLASIEAYRERYGA